MKIVVLDGQALNPGDLDWSPLCGLGQCEVFARTPAELVVDRAREAGAVIINKVVFDAPVIEQLPGLKYIGLSSTGSNVVDLDACRRRGIVVTNVPAYSTLSVAQMTFAHILNLATRLVRHAASVAGGDWTKAKDFSYTLSPQRELAAMTLGVVGLGEIGRAVAKIAGAFGMTVLGCRKRNGRKVAGVELVPLEQLFRRSDIVTLHLPLTPETTRLINAETLKHFKPGAWLINTARGPLLDDRAVADALNAGRLGGAGLDVLTEEPPPATQPLLTAANCFITPHIAWATLAARRRLLEAVVANLAGWQEGQPVNVVT